MKNNIILLAACLLLHQIAISGQCTVIDWKWSRVMGEEGVAIQHVFADLSGNLLIAGIYTQRSTFGGYSLPWQGGTDAFIAKGNQSGDIAWVRTISGKGNETIEKVRIDFFNNIFVCGIFSSDTLVADTVQMINKGMSDIFMIKYTTIGNILISKHIGGTKDEMHPAMCPTFDFTQHFILGGTYHSDTLTVDSHTFINSGSPDIFILRCDADGNIIASSHVQGQGTDMLKEIASDYYGGIYIAGQSDSDTIRSGNLAQALTIGYDVFIFTFNSSLQSLSSARIYGNGNETIASMVVDPIDKNIYVAGSYTGSTVYCNGSTVSLSNNGNSDSYLAHLSTTLTPYWARKISGTQDDIVHNLVYDYTNLYLAGTSNSPEYTIDNKIHSSMGNTDLFVGSFSKNGDYRWSVNTAGSADDKSFSLIANTDDLVFTGGTFNSNPAIFGYDTLLNPAIQQLPFMAQISTQKPRAEFHIDYPTCYCTRINFLNHSRYGNYFIWQYGDGTSDTTYTTEEHTHTYPYNYDYTITLIAVNSCGRDTIQKIVSVFLPYHQGAVSSGLKLYPNPANGIFTIELPLPDSDWNISITDITGAVLSAQKTTGAKTLYNTSGMPSGIYIINAVSNHYMIQQKIIIQ